jgi:hypothetical protein
MTEKDNHPESIFDELQSRILKKTADEPANYVTALRSTTLRQRWRTSTREPRVGREA